VGAKIRLTEPLDVAVGLREANVVVGVRVRTEVGLVARVGHVEIMSAAPVNGKETRHQKSEALVVGAITQTMLGSSWSNRR
jgi:hypothetical protein